MPAGEGGLAACPFCGDAIARMAFLADARFLALHNIAPVLPGHSLVIPRRHVERLSELADDDLAAMTLFARGATRVVAHAFAADAFDWTIQDGAAAGQSVPHLHLHVIPRHAGDLASPGDWYPALMASAAAPIDSHLRPRLSAEEHTRISERLRALARACG